MTRVELRRLIEKHISQASTFEHRRDGRGQAQAGNGAEEFPDEEVNACEL